MAQKNKDYKQIRIFLSSTFRDMQKERDALVKLFRQLAVEGRKHRVSITLLDLRWGITDDQKRNGLVISTCLREIDNSRPFFIGLIGQRYGWIPSGDELKSADLFVKYPRLQYYAGKGMSITEIEMRYGALDTDSSIRAIFLQKEGVEPESENHRNLIKDIDISDKTDLFMYDSIESLVEIVKEEFLKMMGESLEEEERDSHDKLLDIQDRVAYQKTEGYINISDYKKQLDEWRDSGQPVVAVTGESGCGKTSLIASWINDNRNKFTHIIHYFIGEEDGSTDPMDIQKFIIHEIEQRYNLDSILKENKAQEELYDDFAFEMEEALKEVEKNGDKLLLVLDGLNYIDQGMINKLLLWLPELPEGVKMILSTIPEDLTFNSITETKNYPLIEMGDLNGKEVERIAIGYLGKFGKSLDLKLIRKIADNNIYHKNSILKILLDDLIAYGVYEELPKQVEKYVKAKDVEDFFIHIIERAEDFYGKEKIRNLLLLLLVTKNGLEETDIHDVLGITPIEWSEIYCGLVNYLIFSEGKYTIRYPELNAAIEKRYSNRKQKEIDAIRKRILKVLNGREGEESEIAYQAYRLEEIDLLHATLQPFDVLVDLSTTEEMYFFEYWDLLKQHGFSFREYLENMPEDKEYLEEKIGLVSILVDLKLNDIDLATEFVEKYLHLLSDSNEDRNEKANLYLYLARLYNKYYNIAESESYAFKAKEIFDNLPDTEEWEYSDYYFVMGSNLQQREKYEEALEAFDKALELARKNERHEESEEWSILNRKGSVELLLQRFDDAIMDFEKALELISSILTSRAMESSQIINNLGYCYLEKGEFDLAEEYLNKAINQLLEIYGNPNLEMYFPLTNLVTVKIAQKDYKEAMDILKYILNILDGSNQTYEHQYLFVYEKFGEVEAALGNNRKAKKWFKKVEELADRT